MSGKRYELVFGSWKIGVVTESDTDFPNLWGEIDYDPALAEPDCPDAARLVKFVALNQDITRLIDVEHERDVSREMAAVNAKLAGYADYIESENWYLIDSDGQRLPILCPLVRGSREVVWRWNLLGTTAE